VPRARHTCTLLTVAAAFVACGGTPGPTEDVGSTSQAITTSEIVSRADQWVTAQLLYCQSPNGASDTIDPSCPSVCVRESNPSWDPYRSDCSGFVSWAWGLPAPGNTTDELAPADTSVSYVINGADLQPGDALNIPGDHVVLFVSWVTAGATANFYEEPGCSATPNYAHAFTSDVTISGSSVTIAYEGLSFTAIRYSGVTAGDGGAAGSGSGSGSSETPASDCYSDTLGVNVPTNTCVQSASDDAWYQCDEGSWVDRATDPAACIGVYPLGSAYDAGIDAAATTTPSPDAATPSASSASGGGSGAGASSGGSAPAHDGGVAPTAPSRPNDAGAPWESVGSPSGCSASARGDTRSAPGVAWLFALASLGVAASRRRLRRVAS
jgi:MYXO-CTERM domain-containing protein